MCVCREGYGQTMHFCRGHRLRLVFLTCDLFLSLNIEFVLSYQTVQTLMKCCICICPVSQIGLGSKGSNDV